MKDHRMSSFRVTLVFVLVSVAYAATGITAQAPAVDPSARLRAVLPPDVATRVLARIAEARSRGLPADALELRALKFAAKGVAADAIERSVSDQADRMLAAKASLSKGRGAEPATDEVEAAAETMRKGVERADISAFAKAAPPARSLAVPLYVIGSLLDQGIAPEQALQRVQERLQARATDADLQTLPAQRPDAAGGKPAQTGRELAATKRPAGAGAGRGTAGPPAGLPVNAGAAAHPTAAGKGRRP